LIEPSFLAALFFRVAFLIAAILIERWLVYLSKFLDNFFSKKEQQSIAEFSRKAKGELSKLPVVSAVGDAIQGASGLAALQKELEQDPNNPKNWLYFYEANMMYKKINGGANIGRVFINPVGFIVGKGISTGLNTLDDEYEKFDPKKCIGMTIALVMKKIKKDKQKIMPIDLVILSKALCYSSTYANNKNQLKMLDKSINYISMAIKLEKDKRRQAEYFFYLSQFYNQAGRENLQLRSLNVSRKLGFQPADKLLKSLLKKKTQDTNEKNRLDQNVTSTPYKTFYFTYSPDIESRAGDMWENVKEQQVKKISETGKRIGSFLDKHFN
jgi:tetratricopeptide (TPR) repeat protein